MREQRRRRAKRAFPISFNPTAVFDGKTKPPRRIQTDSNTIEESEGKGKKKGVEYGGAFQHKTRHFQKETADEAYSGGPPHSFISSLFSVAIAAVV